MESKTELPTQAPPASAAAAATGNATTAASSSTASLLLSSPPSMPHLAGLSVSPSTAELSARLATALQSRHASAVALGMSNSHSNSSIHASRTSLLHSPRKTRLHHSGASLRSLSSAAATAASYAAGPSPPPSLPSSHSGVSLGLGAANSNHGHHPLVAINRRDPDGLASRKKGVYHHLPPLTEEEKKTLFDSLPCLRSIDDVPAASASLREASLAIIRQWLSDKLSQVSWVALINRIKQLAEGGEHMVPARVPELPGSERQGHVLASMGLDHATLAAAGMPPPTIARLYKALWVYSQGVQQLLEEVAHHASSKEQRSRVVGNVLKCYAILLEDGVGGGGEGYVMALLQMEAESQRVLRELEERVEQSAHSRAEDESKSASESKLLANLLAKSQTESRHLLEKKEALSAELGHLQLLNADLESVATQHKKDLWFTSNQLNRMTTKHDELVKSSAALEARLKADIHELRLEGEEMKASLDQELATNERLSYKVDRFASNIADLSTSTARMRADLNEKVAEIKLQSKVLEKHAHEVAALERDKANIQSLADARVEAAQLKVREAEQKVRDITEAEERRQEQAAAERQEAERIAREQEAAGDPIASSPIVLDLRAQLAGCRSSHEKEINGLQQHNSVLSDRIRALQKRVRELGGGRRFAIKKDSDSDEDDDDDDDDSSSDDSSAAAAPPARSPLQGSVGLGLKSVMEKLKGVSTRPPPPAAALIAAKDDSGGSTDHSSNSSRRSSKKRSSGATRSSGTATSSGLGGGGGAFVSMEVQALQSELDSKEKLNTNLLVSVNRLKVQVSQRDEDAKRQMELLLAARNEAASTKELLAEETKARTSLQKRLTEQSAELDSLRKMEKQSMELRATVHELQKTKIALLSEQAELSASLTEHIRDSKTSRADAKAARSSITKLREEIKALRTECDARCKNQNELGLRIRTLAMENSSLQSLNDEIQRNLRSSADASSLLGSLEMKSAEINRLALRIRDLEHTRVETLKAHEARLVEAKTKADDLADRRVEEALATEASRSKKLRTQLAEQKSNFNQKLEALRAEMDAVNATNNETSADKERLSKENDKLNKQVQSMQQAQAELERKLEAANAAAAAAAASAAVATAAAAAATAGIAATSSGASVPVSPLPLPHPSPQSGMSSSGDGVLASNGTSSNSVVVSPASPIPISAAARATALLTTPSPSPSPLLSATPGSASPLPSPVGSPRVDGVHQQHAQQTQQKRSSSEQPIPFPMQPQRVSSPQPPALLPADVEELHQLVSGEAGPLTAPALSAAVQTVTARLGDRLTAARSQRQALESHVGALQAQVDALRSKLRVAGGADASGGMTEGSGGGASTAGSPMFGSRRRKHKKSISVHALALTGGSGTGSGAASAAAMLAADEADATAAAAATSSDDEGKRPGVGERVRFNAQQLLHQHHSPRTFGMNAKRSSAGKIEGGPPLLPPGSSPSPMRSPLHKSAKSGGGGGSTTGSGTGATAGGGGGGGGSGAITNKSPRSTLTRPVPPSSLLRPTLRRANSMTTAVSSSSHNAALSRSLYQQQFTSSASHSPSASPTPTVSMPAATMMLSATDANASPAVSTSVVASHSEDFSPTATVLPPPPFSPATPPPAQASSNETTPPTPASTTVGATASKTTSPSISMPAPALQLLSDSSSLGHSASRSMLRPRAGSEGTAMSNNAPLQSTAEGTVAPTTAAAALPAASVGSAQPTVVGASSTSVTVSATATSSSVRVMTQPSVLPAAAATAVLSPSGSAGAPPSPRSIGAAPWSSSLAAASGVSSGTTGSLSARAAPVEPKSDSSAAAAPSGSKTDRSVGGGGGSVGGDASSKLAVKRGSVLQAHAPHMQSLSGQTGGPVLVLSGSGTHATSVAPLPGRGTRAASISLSTTGPFAGGPATTAALAAATGLLSPAAAMAALKQLKAKVEHNQRAVNFPKL